MDGFFMKKLQSCAGNYLIARMLDLSPCIIKLPLRVICAARA